MGGLAQLHKKSRMTLESGPERILSTTFWDMMSKSQPNTLKERVKQTLRIEYTVVIQQKKKDSQLNQMRQIQEWFTSESMACVWIIQLTHISILYRNPQWFNAIVENSFLNHPQPTLAHRIANR